MPTNKLTIVLTKLDALTNEITSNHFLKYYTDSSCVIKKAIAEVSCFNCVDERTIQTIMKGLNRQ